MRRLLAPAGRLLPRALRNRFTEQGRAKLIAASGLFDVAWYLERYPDAHGLDPIAHYLRHGAARDPNPLFRADWYLAQNPDVRIAGINPLVHYLLHGAAEGRKPNPLFDGARYLAQNPDVAAAGQNPLAHYLRSGAAEGRPAHPLSLGQWHLERWFDLTRARGAIDRPAARGEPAAGGDAMPYTFDAAGPTGDAEQALADALAAAAAQGRNLLLLMGCAPSPDTIRQLTSAPLEQLGRADQIGEQERHRADRCDVVLATDGATRSRRQPAVAERAWRRLPAVPLISRWAARVGWEIDSGGVGEDRRVELVQLGARLDPSCSTRTSRASR